MLGILRVHPGFIEGLQDLPAVLEHVAHPAAGFDEASARPDRRTGRGRQARQRAAHGAARRAQPGAHHGAGSNRNHILG